MRRVRTADRGMLAPQCGANETHGEQCGAFEAYKVRVSGTPDEQAQQIVRKLEKLGYVVGD